MFIGEKKIARPFRWGIVGGGRTSGVGYKHRLGAMRDNTSFVLRLQRSTWTSPAA